MQRQMSARRGLRGNLTPAPKALSGNKQRRAEAHTNGQLDGAAQRQTRDLVEGCRG